MADQDMLFAHYLPLVNAELVRIGFTEDDFRYLGSGGKFTAEELDTHLADLRQIPSGIGANAFFARYGVDFAAIKQDSSSATSEGT